MSYILLPRFIGLTCLAFFVGANICAAVFATTFVDTRILRLSAYVSIAVVVVFVKVICFGIDLVCIVLVAIIAVDFWMPNKFLE